MSKVKEKKEQIAKSMSVPMGRPQPSLSLDDSDLPAIKEWEVGKKYEIRVNCELVNLSKGDSYYEAEKGKKKYEARFKILSAKSV